MTDLRHTTSYGLAPVGEGMELTIDGGNNGKYK